MTRLPYVLLNRCTTSARGTGLGLAIVRKIVEEHGGHVSLDSTPNRGTKVTLVIPAGT
ncbi:MAG: hypothetical protein KAU41_00990 [Deltaproteobacteria bacterium]|nr:hypothetical protein [Deltaproteobacteria bacterium]